VSHTEEAVRAGLALTPEYYRAIRRDAQGPEKTDPSVDYPAPAHTSRDPWPEGVDMPGPVAGIKDAAERYGWAVNVMYSVGQHPHGTTGRPTAAASWFGVQMLHPESRARVVATYNGKSSTWSTVHLMTRGEITSQGSITDAHEFVALAGRVVQLRSWVMGRKTQRERIAKERAAKRPPRQRAASTSAKRENGG
jgi:hypothetical protein